MKYSKFPWGIEPQDIRRVPWTKFVMRLGANADLRSVEKALQEFGREFDGTDGSEREVFQFLSAVCGVRYRSSASGGARWIPVHVTDAHATPGPSDLPEDLLAASLEEARRLHLPNSLLAHLGDLNWEARRDVGAAKLAVRCYLNMVRTATLPQDWTGAIRQLSRALNLGRQLGNNTECLHEAQNLLQELLELGPLDEGFCTAKLLELAISYEAEDLTRLRAIATDRADAAVAGEKWHRARTYLHLAADISSAEVHQDARQRQAARKPHLLKVAETFQREAEEAVGREGVGFLQAAGHLEKAIAVLRQAGGEQESVARLQKRLEEVQAESVNELLPLRQSIDLSDAVAQARSQVEGKALDESLRILAAVPGIPDPEKLKQNAEENADKFLFLALFPKQILSPEGKVVERYGSVGSTDEQERIGAIRGEMLTYASYEHQAMAVAVINPIRQQIIFEHSLEASDLFHALAFHPAIGAGREMLWAEGLLAGFFGDFGIALHLLVPQFEDSVRRLLSSAGETPSSIDALGIQREHNLNKLLYNAKLKEILGRDVVFALQGLMVEKIGGDFRNRIAHGLVDYGSLRTGGAVYLWWLLYRFAILPVLRIVESDESEARQ